MSTKSTLVYARTEDVTIHIYTDVNKGEVIDLKYKNFNTSLLINKEQAESLVKQLRGEEDG